MIHRVFAFVIVFALSSLVATYDIGAAESKKYPAPRFPSYLKPPKSIDDVMPFARAAVRQTRFKPETIHLTLRGLCPDCRE